MGRPETSCTAFLKGDFNIPSHARIANDKACANMLAELEIVRVSRSQVKTM